MKKFIHKLFSMRNIFSVILYLLPKRLSHPLIRRKINLNYKLPKDLIFKIAETKYEREQAFQILQEAFLERNLVDKNETGIRVTKYHALPTTSVLIIKDKNKVIGTMSVINDSPLRLPVDELSDISEMRKNHKKITEVSAFAIRKGLKYSRSYLMFPIMRFMSEYTHFYLHSDCLIIATHPRMQSFYTAVLGFKPVDNKIYHYEFVKGAKAFIQYIRFDDALKWQEKIYRGKPPKKSYYSYAQFDFSDNFIFPERTYYQSFDATMSAEDLDYFFNDKSNIFSNLSLDEKKKIKELYFFKYYNKIIEKDEKNFQRKYPRFPTNCPTRITAPAKQSSNGLKQDVEHQGIVTQVGEKGVGVYSSRSLKLNEPVYLNIQLADDAQALIKANPIWTDNNGQYGCELIQNKSGNAWAKFIFYLEKDFFNLEKKSA